MTGSTEDTRAALADLLNVPVESILHYAIAVNVPGGLLHQFCGMPMDGIMLHAAAVSSLAVNAADIEASKMAAGCTACRDEAPEK